MSRIKYASILPSLLLALVSCQKKQAAPAAQSKPSLPAPEAEKNETAFRWARASVIAGSRRALVPDAPAPERSLWTAAFEGKDAREVKLTLPYVAVQDASGRVFIADKVAHSVRWVDEIQEIHTAAGTGQESDGQDAPQPGLDCGLSFPNALWVHPSGRLYVLDFGNAKLRRLNRDGKIETLFTLPKGLQGGRGLVLSADESMVYVAAKDRIYRYDGQGVPKVFAQGFVNLGHLVLTPDNELFAADRDAGYVYKIDPSGKKERVAGDGSVKARPSPVLAIKQGLDQPRGLAWSPELGLLIATQGGRRVYRLNPAGELELLLDGRAPDKNPKGSLALRISEPLGKLRALSVAPNGDLLLTHGDVGQILRFKKEAPLSASSR